MLRPITAAVAGAVLLAAVAACGGGQQPSATGAAPPGSPSAPETNPGGDIPDTTTYVPFSYVQGHFQVSVPQGWARTQQGGVVVFTDKLNSVRLEAKPSATAPTVDSARVDEVPAIRADARNVKVDSVQAVQRKAGNAIEIAYSADGPPDPVTGKTVRDAVTRYEFFRNGTEAVLTLAGPVGADNVDPWRTVTDSFGWTP